ncbi:MAG: hypothetical protein KJO07_20465, partial [Deltaproteobacteria bacterium]|nr:hypothetical protein [Deltaproteobacteria bacterium]
GETPDYKELARRVTQGDHPVPSDVDEDLAEYDPLIQRALEPERDRRYQSAAEFRDDVQRELVRVNPTISGDDIGLFVRHLFAEERIAWRKRLDGLMADAAAVEWDKRAEDPEPTVTFAMGERFAPHSLAAPSREPDTTEVADRPMLRRLLIPGMALAALIVVGLAVALVVSSMGDEDQNQPQPTTDPPEPIVEQLDETEIAPDGGPKPTPVSPN